MSKKRSKFREQVSSNTQKQEARGSQFGYLNFPEEVKQFKEEPGKSVKLDIMPYEVTDPKHPDRDDEKGVAIVGELWYKRPFRVHHNIGTGDQRRTVVCPSSIGKKCPICEFRAARREKGAEQDEINALNYSYRNLYVVIPKDHKDYEEEPHLWDIAQGNFQKALNEEIKTDDSNGVFPDLEEGMTLRVRFSEESFAKNKYAKASRIDFIERDEPYNEKILEKIPNIDTCLKVLPYDELKNLFLEIDDEESEEVPITTQPHKMTRKPKEEDEEEKPPKKKEKLHDKKDDDEEDEEILKKKGKCPHGHRWGVDCEETDDCDECKMWDECIDAKEELEKNSKRKNKNEDEND